jgi:fibronectin-binding autotransporter adhesin
VKFEGEGSGVLVLDTGGSVKTIEGLGISDKLDLTAIEFADNPTATYDAKSGLLTVSDSDGHSVSLTLSGADYCNAHFASSSDGHGGTLITLKANDDAPVVTADDAQQRAEVAELADTTGSSTLDPSPAASGAIHFTDIDLTDRPTASILSGGQSVTWTDAHGTDLSSSLTSAQIAVLEQALTLTQSGNTNNGTIGWSYAISDNALDFLGADQTVQVATTVTIDDHQGGTAAANVLVTICGSNDAPIVTGSSATIAEQDGKTGSNLPDTASGAVTFTDVDVSDTHTVKVTGVSASGDVAGLPESNTLMKWLSLGSLTDSQNGATGSQNWMFYAADKVFDYLADDQSVTLTYTVQVDDGHGGVVTAPVTIKIDGAEDTPIILGETDPSVQTVILSKSAIVLAAGTTMNAAGLTTETFDHQQAGSASNNGHGHGDFYSTELHAWFDGDGNAGVVHGSSAVSAAPYQDGTNYLSVGANGQETITFDHQQNSFGLYWGSVDSFNSIEFYNANKLVASYDGSDVAPLLANGGQGSFASNGYVEFLDLAPFTKVVLQSSQNAFELDNVSAGYLDDSHVKLASAVGGTLTVTDKDIGDTLTASVIGDAVVKYNGSSHLPGDFDVDALVDSSAIKFDSVTSDGNADVLHWTYDPAGANLDFLEPGDTLTITYRAQVSDGHGSFGLQPLTITITGNGSSTVTGTAQNDTFDDVGGGVTIFGKGGNDTFVFNPQFGSATIADFDVTKDTLEVNHALFGTSVQDVLNSAQAANAGLDTVLVDAAHETITLKGVTLAQLTAHQNDFHIV